MFKKFQQNEKGLVLLYALLVISFLTAIAITVSIIVVNELKQTIGATDATVAYYTAESGIERGLYTVKRRRADANVLIGGAVLEIQSFDETMDESDAHFSTSGTATGTSQIFHETVLENDFTQVDYYDAEDPLDPIPSHRVSSLVIINEGDDLETWAEVSWTAWDTNGQLGTSERARVVIGPTDLSNGWTISALDVFYSMDPVGYRVRIKPLFGDLSDLTVIPYNQEGAEGSVVEDLPSQVEIKSIGTLGTFKQALTARVPWKVPLFGLYDYVLFSEGDIIKEVVLSRPVFSSGTLEVEANLDSALICDYTACDACSNWQGLECFESDKVYCRGSSAGDGGDNEPEGSCEIGADADQWGYTLPIPDTVPEGDEYYISIRMAYQCCDPVDGSSVCPEFEPDTGTCVGGVSPPPGTLCDMNNDCDVGNGGNCQGGTAYLNCRGRDLDVEINGQLAVLDDQAQQTGNYGIVDWRTCTIPEAFSLGDPALPEDNPARTIQFKVHPFSSAGAASGSEWRIQDYLFIDWYQLSTYKMFDDCE